MEHVDLTVPSPVAPQPTESYAKEPASTNPNLTSMQPDLAWHAINLDGLEGITKPLTAIAVGDKDLAAHRALMAQCSRHTIRIKEEKRLRRLVETGGSGSAGGMMNLEEE